MSGQTTPLKTPKCQTLSTEHPDRPSHSRCRWLSSEIENPPINPHPGNLHLQETVHKSCLLLSFLLLLADQGYPPSWGFSLQMILLCEICCELSLLVSHLQHTCPFRTLTLALGKLRSQSFTWENLSPQSCNTPGVGSNFTSGPQVELSGSCSSRVTCPYWTCGPVLPAGNDCVHTIHSWVTLEMAYLLQ